MTLTVLLSCSISLSGSNATILYGGGQNDKDSVSVSISDLRVATSKMLELKYLKEIDAKKDTIIINKDVQINTYKSMSSKYKKQRNIVGGSLLLSLILLLLK